MSIVKIVPLLECNICYETKIVINCNNELCDWKMCRNCLLKYEKTKCPACRKDNSFKKIDNKCYRLQKFIKKLLKNFYKNIFNYFYRQYLVYSHLFKIFKSLIKEEKKCPQVLYLILIVLLFSVGGSIILNSIFFNNKVIKWTFFEWMLYLILGFLLISFIIIILILFYFCINPIINC